MILIFSSIMIICFLFLLGKPERQEAERMTGYQQDWASIFAVVILYLFVNAFVTGVFSTVLARYQARVFWVLPFMCLLYCLSKIMAAKQGNNNAETL